jgi:hypothetical protein
MRMDQTTSHDAPIGRFRVQVLSSDQSLQLAHLLYFADFFSSELGGTSKMWRLCLGKRRALKYEEIEHIKSNSVNEIEVQATFPPKSQGNTLFAAQTASARLALSPTSELWADPEGSKTKGKAEIRRLNYHLRHEFVVGRGLRSYPSLLDMVVFRCKSRTEQDSQAFFDMVIAGLARAGLDLVQFACGDFNRRTEDILVWAEKLHLPPSEIGVTLDQGHEILVVSATLAKKLQAQIDKASFLQVRELSNRLTAILFADGFLGSPQNRLLLRRTAR